MPILVLFIGLMTGLLLGTIAPLKSIAEQGGIQADTGILYELSIGIPAGILTGVIVSAWFGHASFLRERLDSMARELRDKCFNMSEALGWHGYGDEYLSAEGQKQLHSLLGLAESSSAFCTEYELFEAAEKFNEAAEFLRIAEHKKVIKSIAFDRLYDALLVANEIAPPYPETVIILPAKRLLSSCRILLTVIFRFK